MHFQPLFDNDFQTNDNADEKDHRVKHSEGDCPMSVMGPPASGWYIEIEEPSSGNVLTPDPADVTPQPTVNDRPGIEVTVEQADRWQQIAENNPDTQIPMRVWEGGYRRPIDSLDDVRETAGQSVLVGSGGRELKRRVNRDVDQSTVPQLVRDLVNNNTSYTANVDTPTTTTQTNQTLASLSTTADFQSQTRIGPTDPLTISGDSISLLDANEVIGAVNPAGSINNYDGWVFDTSNADADSGGSAQSDTLGATIEYDIEIDYDYPATDDDGFDSVEVAVRDRPLDGTGEPATVRIYLDGTFVAERKPTTDSNFTENSWTVSLSSNLSEGTHTVTFEVVETGNTRYELDWVAISDGSVFSGLRYDHSLPDSVPITFDGIPAAEAVTGGRAELSTSVEKIELSNDQGDSFGVSATSTDTVEGDFSSPEHGPSLTLRVTIGRTSATSLGSVTLKADLEDMPLAVNKTLSGSLDNVLRSLAETTDSIWEFRRESGTESVEWAKAGQRSSNSDPALSNFEVTTATSDIVNKAIVFGRSQERSGEPFVANHGTAVDLRFGEIHEGSQVVRDPVTGRTFRHGADYAIDWGDGTITTKSSGRMADGKRYEIDYQYQVRGEYDNGSATPETTVERELPALTTEMTVSQAARIIVDELEEPLIKATATAPPEEFGWTVIEEIDVSNLPGGSLNVRAIEPTPKKLTLTLGSRRTISEVFQDLNSQLSTVSRRT